uniref:Reverse transcriptase Ty1/copia-type domain-containing protein n=1 Tax=Fagus sylvatica TaxID=28930 RepID=A0A2N9ISU3_FAGSY
MTPPPPLERSRKARPNRTRINLIRGRTRRHALPKYSAAVKLFPPCAHAPVSYPVSPSATRSNQKISHLICAFCKHRGHTIDLCNMRAGILQRFVALTASESVSSSDAASFDPVSLTTPTYSIANLQALFSQVQVLSSSASNPALSVTPGISSEWFLDSACCNHMTDNPHLTSAHTPPVLPTITTADGSAMTVSHVGSISTPNLSVSDVFCVPKLYLNLLSVGQLTELGLNLFFSSRSCLVQDSRTGQSVGTARKVGQLFELTSLHLPSSSVSSPVIAASTSIELWHSRLGLSPMQPPLLPHSGVKLLLLQCTPSTDVLHLSFKTQHHMNGLFGTAPNYSLLKGYRCYDPVAKRLRVSRHAVFWEHKIFYSLPLSFTSNSDSQADPLPNLFPEIPSPSVESVNPISDESPPVDPSSDESPTADPTFDESPLSAPAANPVNTTTPEPRRSHRASSDPLWQQAMKEELDALLKTGTWDLVDLPAGKSAIGCKWVYKIKTRSDGTVDRYKARLVAKGFTQEYGIDYEETFSPVARLFSVRTLIAVSASSTLATFSDGCFSPKVCRLRQALYGLKQAPRAWFAKFSSTISQHGFLASSYDSALFFRLSDHGITLLLLIWVLSVIFLALKSLPPPMVTISLKPSTHLILSLELELTDSKIVDTTIEYNNRLNTHDGEPLPDATLYRQLVGSLVYLTVTQPDISYAVHIVSQFMAAPRSLLLCSCTSDSSAYSAADWAGDPTDCRSTTGYCFLLGDSFISWRSKKQSVVTRSSTEAEYRALADTTAELLWLRWLLQDLGIDCSTAVPIHCDNRSAIQIAHNDVFHERTKHIEIDCHFVRHHLLQGTLQLRSVFSQDQLADIFTKAVSVTYVCSPNMSLRGDVRI